VASTHYAKSSKGDQREDRLKSKSRPQGNQLDQCILPD
jgi:hypothetical protein